MEKSRQVLGTAPTTSEYNKVLQVELMILLSKSILCFMYEDYENWTRFQVRAMDLLPNEQNFDLNKS
jgi:hypothetical protein